MPSNSDFIETAAKRGAEIVANSRPLNVGEVANAATRTGKFTDPELNPETELPLDRGLFFPGDLPGDNSKELA